MESTNKGLIVLLITTMLVIVAAIIGDSYTRVSIARINAEACK